MKTEENKMVRKNLRQFYVEGVWRAARICAENVYSNEQAVPMSQINAENTIRIATLKDVEECRCSLASAIEARDNFDSLNPVALKGG